jgi:hypothetical protein
VDSWIAMAWDITVERDVVEDPDEDAIAADHGHAA